MFAVQSKVNGRVYNVFHVAYDSSGYPTFLIYDDGHWRRVSAKDYRSIERGVVKVGDYISKTTNNNG